MARQNLEGRIQSLGKGQEVSRKNKYFRWKGGQQNRALSGKMSSLAGTDKQGNVKQE